MTCRRLYQVQHTWADLSKFATREMLCTLGMNAQMRSRKPSRGRVWMSVRTPVVTVLFVHTYHSIGIPKVGHPIKSRTKERSMWTALWKVLPWPKIHGSSLTGLSVLGSNWKGRRISCFGYPPLPGNYLPWDDGPAGETFWFSSVAAGCILAVPLVTTNAKWEIRGVGRESVSWLHMPLRRRPVEVWVLGTQRLWFVSSVSVHLIKGLASMLPIRIPLL